VNPTESGSRDKRKWEDKAMVCENWTSEEKRRLKKIRIDPVRSPPERLKTLIEYFRTPGASLWAVTEGEDGPFHVSKELGRKIRDLLAKGDLDWVMDETPRQSAQQFNKEWRGLLLLNAVDFSKAVSAYQEELGAQIKATAVHLRLLSGYMPPKVPYGPSHRPFVESVFNRDPELAGVRREFDSALKTGDLDLARELRRQEPWAIFVSGRLKRVGSSRLLV